MDPVTLIVAALVAGAADGLKNASTSAVKDAYSGLRALLRRRFGGGRDADARAVEGELAVIERDPSADASELSARIRAAGLGQDEELIRAASGLMSQVDPEGARTGKYTVTISGGKGIVVGNQGVVTMNFRDGA
ncbi:MAG TPA: hypothetical protein VFX33_15105 [Actinomycetales bacterium]|jgi:hypothetical protein|nr:hypothetical protein [Actinomycetales bacterium]